MKEFEPLIGEWHGEGEIPMEPPMKISEEAKIERLERGMGGAGDMWEIDFPINYFRK